MKKIFILLFSLLVLCSCAQNNNNPTPTTNTIVEEFIGHNVSDVYAWCATLGDSDACEITFEDNDNFDKDIVFEQSVKAGSKLRGNILFKVSSGNVAEVAVPYITPEVTMSDIEVWKEAAGVKTVNYTYETSDTVEKNHVIRMEPSSHITKDTPVTVVISSGKAEPVSTNVEVKYGDFIGLTVEQFEAKAKELGLKPNHQTTRDKHDSNVKIGNIVWHGSGTYEKDEVFNYGVCINQITVNPGDYVGKSESAFIKAAKDMKLNPVRINNRDAYSAKIEKGYVVTHGSGIYEEGEDFKYGLSLGPAYVQQGYEGTSEDNFLAYLEMMDLRGERKTMYSSSIPAGKVVSYNYGKYSANDVVTYYISLGPEETYVDVPDFSGRSESDLLNFLSSYGILAGSRSEQSSLIPKGSIVYNDHGKMKAGEKASYTVSTGPAVQETAILESFDTIYQDVTAEGDYERAAWQMHRYLFGRGFMDYDIIPVVYGDYEPGILLSIEYDGERLGEYPVNVPINAHIEVLISSDINN